jgi:hypothetical protein
VAGGVSCPDRDGEASGQLEGGSNLGGEVRRVVLERLDVRNDVTLTLEMGGQPRAEEILRPES